MSDFVKNNKDKKLITFGKTRRNKMSTESITNTEETVIKFRRKAYQEVCRKLRDVLQREKEIAKEKEELRASVLCLCGGNRMEYGIKVERRKAKGTIDYKAIVAELEVSEDECEMYRKDPREYWDVRSY